MRARTQDSNNSNYVRVKVKVKVKAFILYTPRRCIEGVEGELQLFLTSALDVSEGLDDLSLGRDTCPPNRRVRGRRCRSGRFGTEIIFFPLFSFEGTAVEQWLRCCATNRKVAGSIPAGVSGFFIDIKFFRSHYSPEVDSASN